MLTAIIPPSGNLLVISLGSSAVFQMKMNWHEILQEVPVQKSLLEYPKPHPSICKANFE
ncbi:hypothetical protein I79_005540 [Cricetulus griseus]|uniref:Uncharacterized protein n=1 Tax=Cricetulus griseus TaxID=10029 RepID=G3H5G0_CRIGR|nr:hypothetical protein I79_005540 [Cricetulus griseus]